MTIYQQNVLRIYIISFYFRDTIVYLYTLSQYTMVR